jgi:hypothetical protein
MKYQRVLYTKKLTLELKSKLRIVSCHRCRSLKGNVYYVSFASDLDTKYADRISKHLRNVTLKPFQPRRVSESQCESCIKTSDHRESLAFSSVSLSSSSLSSSISLTSTRETSNLVSFNLYINLIEMYVSSNIKAKEQLINDVQLCLNAIEIARRAANEFCQLYSKILSF